MSDEIRGSRTLEERVRRAGGPGTPALIPYVVAGRPDRTAFSRILERVASLADVVEIGLPFSDPVADGPVIARAARSALADGVSLPWLVEAVASVRSRIDTPLVLMSYLNPLLAGGLPANLRKLAENGFDGLIVPDLPLEECAGLRSAADEVGLALVQIVTPATPPERGARIAAASRGFLYATTRSGITGARSRTRGITGFLDRLRSASPLPVCAGFGIRDARQVRELDGHVDGVIVGTALVEAIERGRSPGKLLRLLRGATGAAGPRTPLTPPAAPRSRTPRRPGPRSSAG